MHEDALSSWKLKTSALTIDLILNEIFSVFKIEV